MSMDTVGELTAGGSATSPRRNRGLDYRELRNLRLTGDSSYRDPSPAEHPDCP